MATHRLQRVGRTARGEPAARRQQGREGELVAPDDEAEQAAWQQHQPGHGSSDRKGRLAPGEELTAEIGEPGAVRLSPGPDKEVAAGVAGPELPAPDFLQSAAETIAGHRAELELRDDQSQSRVARYVIHPDHFEVLRPAPSPFGQAAPDIGCAGEPVGPLQALRFRQEPPCLEGIETVSRFRPFLRRRDSVALPQGVAIRARNPCLLIRRRFRGR